MTNTETAPSTNSLPIKIVRAILAVIIGYAIFAASAVLFFKFTDYDPHAESGNLMIAIVVAYGVVFSLLGGAVAKLIAGGTSLTANILLAVVIAGFAAVSAFLSPGSHYTQIAAIVAFAPASLIGGWITSRTK